MLVYGEVESFGGYWGWSGGLWDLLAVRRAEAKRILRTRENVSVKGYHIPNVQVAKMKRYALKLGILLFCFTMIPSVSAGELTVSKIISTSGEIGYKDGLSWLHVDGRYIKDELGATVYLRGVNKLTLASADSLTSRAPPPYEEFMWHNLAESDFDTIKSLGANCIRFGLSVENFFPDFNLDLPPNADFLAMLDNIVNWCEKRDVRIIFTLQSYNAIDGIPLAPSDYWTNPMNQENVNRFWRFVADRYKERPIVCGINYMCEPWHWAGGPPSNEVYRNWMEIAIDTITQVNPQLLFFVSDARVDDSQPLSGENSFRWMRDTPVRRDNIILSPHFYPYDGDWNWMSGTDWGAAYAEGRYDEGKRLFADWIWDQWCADLNYPFMVGEFACVNHTVGLEWLQDFYEIMNDWGWNHAYYAWQAQYPGTLPDIYPVEGDWHTLRPQGEVIKACLS